MRIIGGKDYYDGAGGYDSSVIFVRTPKEYTEHPVERTYVRLENEGIYLFYVLIAGVSYPAACLINHNNAVVAYMYTLEQAQSIVDSQFRLYWIRSEALNKINTHFNRNKLRHLQWAIDNKIVVGYNTTEMKNTFIANADNLKSISFYKFISPYELHMECARFISGVIPNNKPTIALSDKSKIIKAGFDTKISFRGKNK